VAVDLVVIDESIHKLYKVQQRIYTRSLRNEQGVTMSRPHKFMGDSQFTRGLGSLQGKMSATI
jgi:hypothetical protein